MSGSQPSLWVFAGPNGAGKSTLVQRYKVGDRIPMVNPDDIALAIRAEHGTDQASAQTKAGRIAVAMRARLLAEGRSFGIETTLTGRKELQLMQAARNLGYKVNLVYVGLESAEDSNSRVMARVRRGGHDVPEQDIYRRFGRSLVNLPAAIHLSDRVRVLDNSDEHRRLVLKIDKGRARAVSRTMPEWVKHAIPCELRSLRRDKGMGY